MSDVVLNMSPEAKARLEALAVKLDKSVTECLQLALSEFLTGWEDHFGTLSTIDAGEKRPVLTVIHD